MLVKLCDAQLFFKVKSADASEHAVSVLGEDKQLAITRCITVPVAPLSLMSVKPEPLVYILLFLENFMIM